MAWGQDAPPAPAKGDKSRFAAPPTCPRCELTKSQMNRTIQNYQKAYRKKVEGLKQELSTTRADNTHLRSQVRRLCKKRLLHAPSLLVGAAIGFFATKLVQIMRRSRQQQQQSKWPAATANGDTEVEASAKAVGLEAADHGTSGPAVEQ